MADSKRALILNPQRILLAEYARQDFVVNAEEGTTVQDVLDPAYWSHTSSQFKPYDRVEVRLETGEWLLELMVLSADRNWARVHVLQKHELQATAAEAPPAAKHITKWRGPQHKHCVVRVADGEVLSKGHDDNDAALAWLKNYENVTMVS